MTLRLVFNPADTPVATDAAGHILGGGEWDTVDSRDPITSNALQSQALIEAPLHDDQPDSELNPRFAAARAAHREIVERAEQARKLERPQLAELVEHDAPKAQLVHEVAASTVEIPKPQRGGSRTSKES